MPCFCLRSLIVERRSQRFEAVAFKLARLDTPEKNWKFAPGDVRERGHWKDYMHAFEQMLAVTSTDRAPWYVIPADHRHVARSPVASVPSSSIQSLGLTPPTVSDEDKAEFEVARARLLAQK